MNESGNSKNIGTDKIVLLGLFILSLLTAKLIVNVKSRLIFSDPIELADTGLSISIPTGNGWIGQQQWHYEDNISTLNSIFTINLDHPSAWVNCEYMPDYQSFSSLTWFERRAADINGTILEIDRIEKENLTIDWTHIEKPEVFLEIFLATIELDNNRRLNIEVQEIASDIEQAETVFLEILNRLSYRGNQSSKPGTEVITQSSLSDLNRSSLIERIRPDSQRKQIGIYVFQVFHMTKPFTYKKFMCSLYITG